VVEKKYDTSKFANLYRFTIFQRFLKILAKEGILGRTGSDTFNVKPFLSKLRF
jgi:hypothetical protein